MNLEAQGREIFRTLHTGKPEAWRAYVAQNQKTQDALAMYQVQLNNSFLNSAATSMMNMSTRNGAAMENLIEGINRTGHETIIVHPH